MRNKKSFNKPINILQPSSIVDSSLSATSSHSWLSNQLLTYYKHKSSKLEKEYNDLLDLIENVKSNCSFSNELQLELNSRNEEVSKLQQVIGDLQMHLFREREDNIKLTCENDQLKIADYENKKKINMLLMVNGTIEKKYCQFITTNVQGEFVQSKLPPKLQKLKEEKNQELMKFRDSKNTKDNKNLNDDLDPHILMLNNQLLKSQLDHHKKLCREQIDVLLQEKELSREERQIERLRMQKELDILSAKLKESQDLLCDTTEKLIKLECSYDKEKTVWMEDKDKYEKLLNILKGQLGYDIPELWTSGGSSNSKTRLRCEGDLVKLRLIEKERLAAEYQQQASLLEAEINKLRERAETCRKTFKEKTEKMTAQVSYLKNKYNELDRRRILEGEGFRTDIRMLRERIKELEKKLTKTTNGLQSNEQQQLLVSARNTLNRAKQLEKELVYMKSKLYALEARPSESDL